MRMNECLCIVLCPPSCKWQYQIGVSGGMAEQIVSGRHRRYVYKHIRLVAVNSNASAFVIHACVNLLPAGAKSPLHKRSLCNGCIVFRSQTPRALRERNLSYRRSDYAYKNCRHDSKKYYQKFLSTENGENQLKFYIHFLLH